MIGRKQKKVVLLGFDACDIDLVRVFARSGKLPTFRRLLQSWSCARVNNPYGFFVGATWTSFFTARSAGKLGFHCWDTISANYERRLTSPTEIVAGRFWDLAGESGRRVAVLDVPHSRATDGQSVLEVSEYGCHDRHFGLRCSRGAVRDEITSRFGFHPVFTVDPFSERHFAADDYVHRAAALRSADEEALLQRDLLAGLQRKHQLAKWIYGQDAWDLFISIFGESHAVGHQSWYLHDLSHPRHNSELAHVLGDPLESVYAALDGVLADFLSTIGNECQVLVLLSHGMQAHYDGTYILEPALARMDSFDRTGVQGNPIGRWIKAGWLKLDDQARSRLIAPLKIALQQSRRMNPPAAYFETDIGPSTRARQRFYMAPNNSVYGGVRVNLKGREFAGLVNQGQEFDALCVQLRHDLMALINVDTGGPVVRGVDRTDAHYQREFMNELPDLLIDWNHDAPVETVWSAKTGIIHAPYWHWRSGDHRPGGFLFLSGPNIPVGADLGVIENRDIGPTICAMLGVELTNVDGRPVPALLGTRE